MSDLLDSIGGESSGGTPTEITAWPETGALNIKHTGYTRQAFIQEVAISLYTAINWDGKNPSTEANNTYQRAVVLANVLGLK